MSKLKPKTKQPKRVKGWMATWPGDMDAGLRATRYDAEFDVSVYGHAESARVARLVEVRSGEVVVDVERLMEEAGQWTEQTRCRYLPQALRAALRKVGVR